MIRPDDTTPLTTGAAQVYLLLREQILRGELPVDEPLSQVKLAERLNIGRTPLREAVRMLQGEGFLRSAPHRRIQIAAISVGDLEDLYAMRIVLEVLGVRVTIPRLTDDQIHGISRHLRGMEAAEEDFEVWETSHVAFHRALVAGAGARLKKSIRDLSDHAVRYRRLYLSHPRAWTHGTEEHQAIFDAVRDRDVDRAGVELARHYARTAFTVASQLAPEHEPTHVRQALRSITVGYEHAE